MSEKGVIGIAMLCLILALISMSLAALSAAKWRQARSRNEMQDIKSTYLVHAAALLSYDEDFNFLERTHEFEAGKVRILRTASIDKTRINIRCQVECGALKRVVEIGWLKRGNDWRAIYWKEAV